MTETQPIDRLYTAGGKVAHIALPTTLLTGIPGVACGRVIHPRPWKGIGSDRERAHAATLPVCIHCWQNLSQAVKDAL